MKHIVLPLAVLILATAALARPASLAGRQVNAQSCTTQYGGTTTCQPTDLIINKEVKNPLTGVFVENLSSTDATFSPGAEVHFRLIIKNTSGETFSPVTVKDVLPDFLTFEAGPGTYDKASRTLTFTTDNLIAGESRSFEIVVRVENKAANQSLFCVTNYAIVTAAARPAGDDDTAQLCIQTRVLGVTTLPVAGFDDLVLLVPFAGLGLGGFALLRKKV